MVMSGERVCVCNYDRFVLLVKRIYVRAESARSSRLGRASLYFTHEDS